MNIEEARALILDVPDYPIAGIIFKDLTPLLADSESFAVTIQALRDLIENPDAIDHVAGIEARGFIFGAALAHHLNKGFITIRKPGKLPRKTLSREYSLEYGTGKLEIHEDLLPRGSRVLIIDDVLATGGTALAAAGLVEDAGGTVAQFAFVLEISALKGHERLTSSYPKTPITSIFYS